MFDNRIAIEERPGFQDYEELDIREEQFLTELAEVTEFELFLACLLFEQAMDDCWD